MQKWKEKDITKERTQVTGWRVQRRGDQKSHLVWLWKCPKAHKKFCRSLSQNLEMSHSAWWLIFGVNLLGFKSSRSICTALGISVRVFPERSNWGYKARPESGWYHTMDWGSERIKGGKGKCYPSISSFFCFLVHHGVNFAPPTLSHHDDWCTTESPNTASDLTLFLSATVSERQRSP